MSTAADTTNGILNEIVTRLEDEGAFDRDVYYELVEEVLEEKREDGTLTDDDDIEEMEQTLKSRWPEAAAALESGHDQDVAQGDES